MRWNENEWIIKDLSKVIYALLPHVLYTKESHIIVIIPTHTIPFFLIYTLPKDKKKGINGRQQQIYIYS